MQTRFLHLQSTLQSLEHVGEKEKRAKAKQNLKENIKEFVRISVKVL